MQFEFRNFCICPSRLKTHTGACGSQFYTSSKLAYSGRPWSPLILMVLGRQKQQYYIRKLLLKKWVFSVIFSNLFLERDRYILHWPNWPWITPLLTRVRPHQSWPGRHHWTHGNGDVTSEHMGDGDGPYAHNPRLLCGLTEWRHVNVNHPLTPMTSNDHCTDHCTDHCLVLNTSRFLAIWPMVVWWLPNYFAICVKLGFNPLFSCFSMMSMMLSWRLRALRWSWDVIVKTNGK